MPERASLFGLARGEVGDTLALVSPSPFHLLVAGCGFVLGCGNAPVPAARPAALATSSATASAAPAPSASSPTDDEGPQGVGPEWLGTTMLPDSLVIDGKVNEWPSLGAAQKGWMALLPDRVVIAGWAPADASAIDVILHVGERRVPGRPLLLRKVDLPAFECWDFSGTEKETCEGALLAQKTAMEALSNTTWRTYEIRGTAVTIDKKPAVSTRGALWTGPSYSRFELSIPLEELPCLSRPLVAVADVAVRVVGATPPLPAEVRWGEHVPVGGEKAILADAVLSAAENHGDILYAVLDPSGKEPVLRAVRLPAVSGKTPDQRPSMVTEPLEANKVLAQTGDLELLRYDALGTPGIATRKAGHIVDAFAIHGYLGGTFARFVVRDADIDVGYEDLSLGGIGGTETRFVGVARANASGAIDWSFAGGDYMVAPGSKRTFARDLSGFDLRARVLLLSSPKGDFVQMNVTWRYDTKTRTYKMDGE